ncbi:nineteen complex-related protein 2-domain-containing protein [Hypoxylon fragiforme]|uniref:nineteen complex-related protein 2-domain-containing protein n=1 Tax=Hypoxylon fragiforme TaxID=63214 RepID=UPI0020C6570B|nr:nineteen complex-related protein 2-domain-containing protein [Hypoxylon fragiforme]KAI2604209.1 nineteen complex-related protein 2-domain-containing protein [Hypoxylon fragiforme]
MSAFGAKRKARKITVQDDEDDVIPAASLNPPEEPQGPALQPSFKTARRPFKSSSLRKSVHVDKIGDDNTSANQPTHTNPKITTEDDNENDGASPLRTRPPLGGKSAAAKVKKRASSSRLSFGVPSEETAADDDDSMILGDEFLTPKRGAAVENSAYKRGISKKLPLDRLPMRSLDTDEDRPRYSKEYLSELQQSTPNTPQDISKLRLSADDDDDEMALDPSELEGALVVETTTARAPSPSKDTVILTETQIQEKKARRARLAKEEGSRDTEDFISLSDNDNAGDPRGHGASYLTVLSQRQDQPHKSKKDTRLIAEDEDLGEGYDEFVEDGGLSLGRKAERDARRRRRTEMASLITAAEGADPENNPNQDAGFESDASEAERRAAYEAAQTRAGMDGLAAERESQRRRLEASQHVAIPRITPLPDFSVLVAEFKARMQRKAEQVAKLRARIEELRGEREGIAVREPEVQRLLNEAGERYRVLMTGGSGSGETANGNGNGEEGEETGTNTGVDSVAAARSLLDRARNGGGGTPTGQRGLESLGTTPVRQESRMEF